MSFDVLGDLNWLAVIVAAILYFVLGALWYARPVFGRMWAEAAGQEMREGDRPPVSIMVWPLAGALLASIAIGMLAQATGTDSLGEGIVLGVVVAVGFAVAISLVTAVFESSKPQKMVWGSVNAGFHAVGSLTAAAIIGAWQ